MKTSTLISSVLLFYIAEAQLTGDSSRPKKPTNVSQTEYETRMEEYQRITKGTPQEREFQPGIEPSESYPKPDGVSLKFRSPNFEKAEGILFKALISRARYVKVYQTMESGEEVEVKSMDIKSYPLWIDAFLERTTVINVRISCGSGCEIQYPKTNVQYATLRPPRNSEPADKKKRICTPTQDAADPCCFTPYRAKFEDLAKAGMDPIVAPPYIDASFCGNYFCWEHPSNAYTTIKNHVLHNPGDPPQSDCAPTVYAPLQVVKVDPNNPDKLLVMNWKTAIAKECGCI
ncbi:hypothetical protein GE061_018519 [Apolygus lucorum]|uniref:TGF-beta family profile domain-containing protein n=1 Tax=Apolygus lucorum TaxID=248454 RepID=A0A6A4J8J3_APOLU|nr:hypothetical protein GE061_018519 [Apolygus lucorum]